MRLFLLRHALAKEGAFDDARPLSGGGEAQVRRLCSVLNKELFTSLAQIWHSPYLRASQTAEMFKECMGLGAQCVVANNIRPIDPAESAAASIASISGFGGDLLIVGHNPNLEELANILLGHSRPFAKTRFSNCAIACFELEDFPNAANKFGTWSLEFLVSPQTLG
ncbi:MAG: phosphohistidine phosphatase SixA [Opitutales bacterium]|nr:phosphohistidine phosphatase SixA [Opitutales bacterium]